MLIVFYDYVDSFLSIMLSVLLMFWRQRISYMCVAAQVKVLKTVLDLQEENWRGRNGGRLSIVLGDCCIASWFCDHQSRGRLSLY
jgi:hypothetical protein